MAALGPVTRAEQVEPGDAAARNWVEKFLVLGDRLGFAVNGLRASAALSAAA